MNPASGNPPRAEPPRPANSRDSATEGNEKHMKKNLVAITLAAVVLTIAVVAGAVYLLRSPSPGGIAAAPPAEPATEVGAPAADTEIPTRPDCPAPGVGGIVLPCLGGENGPADPTTAEITVVNVWAWWCGPCRDELPYFEELAAQHPEYTVVGVHADHNPGNGAAFLNDLDLDLPSYQDDDNTFAGTLGLPGVIPLTLVFQGTEQLALYPQTFASTADIAAAVDQALAGAET